MEIPEKWVKDTINSWARWDKIKSSGTYTYKFSIRRTFLNKGFFKSEIKEETLTEISIDSSKDLAQEEIEETNYFQDFLKIAREIRRLSKGEDWRARALDALSSPMISEKDKFLSDFIESFNKNNK